ncbi:MAG: hypothetical protein WCK86_10470 [Planctomycetia bacterium]
MHRLISAAQMPADSANAFGGHRRKLVTTRGPVEIMRRNRDILGLPGRPEFCAAAFNLLKTAAVTVALSVALLGRATVT